MPSVRGAAPLSFQVIGHADLELLNGLQLEQAQRFLEPLAEIVRVVRRGSAHAVLGLRRSGVLAGFYIVHPDRRDRACWWLGWLAIDDRFKGLGLGRATMAAAMARVRAIQGCRRVRLLVAPDNAPALHLYEQAGFRPTGETWPGTGELILQCEQDQGVPYERRIDLARDAYSLIQAMWLRLWRRGAPPSAQLSGEFHGPPATLARAGSVCG